MNNSDEPLRDESTNTPEEPVFGQSPTEPSAPVSPEPSAPVFTPTEAIAPPKKSHKGLVVTVITLSILLLAAVGYIVYVTFFQPKNETTKESADTSTTQSSASPDAKAIVEKVRVAVTDSLATTYPSMTITSSTNAPAYKADNVNYAVHSNTIGHGLTIIPVPVSVSSDLSSSTKVENVIAGVFETQTGFTKTAVEWQTTYQNDSVICTVSILSSPVSLSCGDKSAYAELITSIKPFAEAYLASEDGKKYGEGVMLSDPKVTQKASGYSSALLSMGNTKSEVGGYGGLFYAKDSTWTYWRGTQALIDCTEYNTRDLQKAFEGDSCSDGIAPDYTDVVKVTL